MDYDLDTLEDDTVWEECSSEDALCEEQAAVDEVLAPLLGRTTREAP